MPEIFGIDKGSDKSGGKSRVLDEACLTLKSVVFECYLPPCIEKSPILDALGKSRFQLWEHESPKVKHNCQLGCLL